jgi:tetratricopeptide (TPR) repeat protein
LLRARALRSFGSSAHFEGDFGLAERLWEESLALYEQLGNEQGIAVLLHRLSISALEKGDVELALKRAEGSLAIHRRLGNDKGACQPLSLLGAVALKGGDRERGLALLEESVALATKIGWRWWRAGTVSALADVALADERTEDAKKLLREAVALALEIQDRVGLSWYLSQYAVALACEGQKAVAGRIWGAVESANVFIPGGPWPRDAQALEEQLSRLADAAFEQAFGQGAKLPLEDLAQELPA